MDDIIIKKVKTKNVIIDYDDFDKFNKYNWFLVKKNIYYYVATDIPFNGKYKRKYLHQIVYGEKKGFVIDHINRNPLDNRKDNLRFVDKSVNGFNSKIRIDNISGFRNISFDKTRNKWVVRRVINGKYKFLGRYNNLEDAKTVLGEAL